MRPSITSFLVRQSPTPGRLPQSLGLPSRDTQKLQGIIPVLSSAPKPVAPSSLRKNPDEWEEHATERTAENDSPVGDDPHGKSFGGKLCDDSVGEVGGSLGECDSSQVTALVVQSDVGCECREFELSRVQHVRRLYGTDGSFHHECGAVGAICADNRHVGCD